MGQPFPSKSSQTQGNQVGILSKPKTAAKGADFKTNN